MLIWLLLCITAGGCSRSYWRKQADEKTYTLLDNKIDNPNWPIPPVDLNRDPRSRFFDPYNPDKPPLPPDDPTAHEYMHCVYGMHGYKHWHKFGDTATVENPCWLEPFGLSEEVVNNNYSAPGVLPELRKLTLEESIDLSYIHSRDYQLQLENLYLSALQLTFEQFRFDVQFVGLTGRHPSSDESLNAVPGQQTTIGTFNQAGASQFLPTGGQWILELANNTVWLFSGGTSQNTSSSVISYSLIQPLLLNGGRRVALESLTQAERNLLYAVRAFERYRMSFFVNNVAGGGTTGTVTPGLIPAPGTPLAPGITVAPGTASAPVIALSGSVSVSTAVTTSTGAVGVGGGGPNGYLDLIQLQQTIDNLKDNIRLTAEQLERLRAQASQRPQEIGEILPALPAGLKFPPSMAAQLRYDAEEKVLYVRGELSEVQLRELLALSPNPEYQNAVRSLAERSKADVTTLNIAQLQSNLVSSKITLNTNERTLQDALDGYKIQLGLPPDLLVTLDDSLLKPFQLIDPRLTKVQEELKDFVHLWARLDDENPALEGLRTAAQALSGLQEKLNTDGMQLIEADLERFRKNESQRLASLSDDQERLEFKRNTERNVRLFASLKQDFAQSKSEIDELQKTIAVKNLSLAKRKAALRTIADLQEDILKTSQGMSVVQINLRVELISLNQFDMPLEQAVAIGLDRRVDLMNSRAQVMDARRRIEVLANQLQAQLDVVVAGDVSTPSNASGNMNPLDFRGDQSSFRAGIAFTTPIQLVSQRNAYRASIIAYQQARRNYMLSEDQVKFSIRTAWRQLGNFRRNFELSRQAIRLAALQLDRAVEDGSKPVSGVGTDQTSAQQGLNLLNALNAVLTAQNNLIQNWINYETNRLNIHRDMNIMEIDERGFWVDEFYQERLRAAGPPSGFLSPLPTDSAYPPYEVQPYAPDTEHDHVVRAKRGAARVEQNRTVAATDESSGRAAVRKARIPASQPVANGTILQTAAFEPARAPVAQPVKKTSQPVPAANSDSAPDANEPPIKRTRRRPQRKNQPEDAACNLPAGSDRGGSVDRLGKRGQGVEGAEAQSNHETGQP